MYSRPTDSDLSERQLRFRESWNQTLGAFTERCPEKCLEGKDALLNVLNELKDTETSENDLNYFSSLYHLTNAIFLAIATYHQTLSGNDGAASLKGVQLNIQEFLRLSSLLDSTRPSIIALRKITGDWNDLSDIQSIAAVIKAINKIALPVILTTETQRYAARQKRKTTDATPEEEKSKEETIVISARFEMDAEPWANPQIIKPGHQYRITGKIKLNKWPEGYDELVLFHSSTTNNEWIILSFPTISKTANLEFPLQGSIVLKYAQSLLEDPISIKLVAGFSGEGKKPIYPKIVGYDQLIVRVIDPSNFDFPTGYDKLNEKVYQIYSEIKRQLPGVPDKEMNNFLLLLSAILNYQGYCLQYGKYKHQDTVSEDEFRDKLIEYLSANPKFSSSIVKEGNVAGGRVEINFNGIVAELKVEKQESERKKIIASHQQQPVAYASAVASQLSILCILDLTEKQFAPAIAAANVFLIAPPLHGHESSSARVAVIFIDGNTKNPSEY